MCGITSNPPSNVQAGCTFACDNFYTAPEVASYCGTRNDIFAAGLVMLGIFASLKATELVDVFKGKVPANLARSNPSELDSLVHEQAAACAAHGGLSADFGKAVADVIVSMLCAQHDNRPTAHKILQFHFWGVVPPEPTDTTPIATSAAATPTITATATAATGAATTVTVSSALCCELPGQPLHCQPPMLEAAGGNDVSGGALPELGPSADKEPADLVELLRMLADEKASVRARAFHDPEKTATQICGNITVDNARRLGIPRITEPLVALLKSDFVTRSTLAAESVCAALVRLASDKDCCRKLLEAGAAPALGSLMRSTCAPCVRVIIALCRVIHAITAGDPSFVRRLEDSFAQEFAKTMQYGPVFTSAPAVKWVLCALNDLATDRYKCQALLRVVPPFFASVIVPIERHSRHTPLLLSGGYAENMCQSIAMDSGESESFPSNEEMASCILAKLSDDVTMRCRLHEAGIAEPLGALVCALGTASPSSPGADAGAGAGIAEPFWRALANLTEPDGAAGGPPCSRTPAAAAAAAPPPGAAGRGLVGVQNLLQGKGVAEALVALLRKHVAAGVTPGTAVQMCRALANLAAEANLRCRLHEAGIAEPLGALVCALGTASPSSPGADAGAGAGIAEPFWRALANLTEPDGAAGGPPCSRTPAAAAAAAPPPGAAGRGLVGVQNLLQGKGVAEALVALLRKHVAAGVTPGTAVQMCRALANLTERNIAGVRFLGHAGLATALDQTQGPPFAAIFSVLTTLKDISNTDSPCYTIDTSAAELACHALSNFATQGCMQLIDGIEDRLLKLMRPPTVGQSAIVTALSPLAAEEFFRMLTTLFDGGALLRHSLRAEELVGTLRELLRTPAIATSPRVADRVRELLMIGEPTTCGARFVRFIGCWRPPST